MAVTELQFRALLPGKTHCLDLVRSALKLFSIYVKEDRAKLRENVLKVILYLFAGGYQVGPFNLWFFLGL